jgi:hypothetical protein
MLAPHETRDAENWTRDDLREAASFRGGICHAEQVDDPFVRVDWTCSEGHRFAMTPNLMLKGGHWCPTCMVDPRSYPGVANRNPFFRQV